MDTTADPSWQEYAQAFLEFPGGIVIDLGLPVQENARDVLSHLPIAPPFAIISAGNFKGQQNVSEMNSSAFDALRRELAIQSIQHFPIVGRSEDGKHRELSLVVQASLVDARRLAQVAEQSAFFWYDGAAFWLIGGLVDTSPLRLPVDSIRLNSRS